MEKKIPGGVGEEEKNRIISEIRQATSAGTREVLIRPGTKDNGSKSKNNKAKKTTQDQRGGRAECG